MQATRNYQFKIVNKVRRKMKKFIGTLDNFFRHSNLRGNNQLKPPKQFFEILKQKIKDISFTYVIKMTTGCKVRKVRPLVDGKVVNEIYDSAKEVLEWSRGRDFSKMRPNEMGNRLEERLRERLRGKIPKGKKAGYPNILIRRGELNYYIEVKLAGEDQLNETLRTFYYKPVKVSKVTKDACHVMVGYVHRNKEVIGFKIVDLSKINVSLKNEFNTCNKELYKRKATIKEYSSQQTLG